MADKILSSSIRRALNELRSKRDRDEPEVAEVEISGSPEAVDETADALGLPGPDEMDDESAEADPMAILKRIDPGVYAKVMREMEWADDDDMMG